MNNPHRTVFATRLLTALALTTVMLATQATASSFDHVSEGKLSCKAGNYLNGTTQLLLALNENPSSIDTKLELASCYYAAGYFDKGSRLFKSLLNDQAVSDRIKANVGKFVEANETAINSYSEAQSKLKNVQQNQNNPHLAIQALYGLVDQHPRFHRGRLQLTSRLIKQGRADEASQQLNSVVVSNLDQQDKSFYENLRDIAARRFQSRTYFTGKGSYTLGHDDNIAGTASNDFYEDDDFFGSEKVSGIFSRLYGNIRYTLMVPSLNSGELTHTHFGALGLSLHERTFFDEEGESRNYDIQDLGFTYGRKHRDQSQLLVPFSIKKIQLNGEDYADYFDAQVRYSWKESHWSFALSQRFSHRNYQKYDPARQNAKLNDTGLNIGIPISDRLSLSGRLDYTVLDTTHEEFRSYERYTQGLSATLQLTNSTAVTTGVKWQDTDYLGENTLLVQPCLEADCEDDVELIYDYVRSDNLEQVFAETSTQLSENWSIKAKWDYVDRESNQNRHTYSRQTITLGIHGKF